MTVRGGPWVFCMVCITLCHTLLAKGRRVLSEVFLIARLVMGHWFSPFFGVYFFLWVIGYYKGHICCLYYNTHSDTISHSRLYCNHS